MTRLSDCCGARIYDESDICSDCKEHCDELELEIGGTTSGELAEKLIGLFIPVVNTGTGLITTQAKRTTAIKAALVALNFASEHVPPEQKELIYFLLQAKKYLKK